MDLSTAWITENLRASARDLGSILPPVFEAYTRIFHPAYRAAPSPERSGNRQHEWIPVTWHAVAEANEKVSHPGMEWASLLPHGIQGQAGLWDKAPCVGRLPSDLTLLVARILKAHSRTKTVIYGLWDGYAELDLYPELQRNSNQLRLPGRRFFLTAKSIEDSVEPFGIPRRTANLWWSESRQWCVVTDIDLMTTYVGSSKSCAHALVSCEALEAMSVDSRQGIGWDSDRLNPLPQTPI